MQTDESNRIAFRDQAEFCRRNSASVTARICDGLALALDEETATGRRVLAWAGDPILDALPLRLVGGIHSLHLAGEVPELDRLYDGSLADDDRIAALLGEAMLAFDARLMAWLDGPPQTNEAGRSSAFVAAMLWLGERTATRFEMLEIGSSAGVNLLIDRYRYRLGDVAVGPPASPVQIEPEWHGASPPDTKIEIVRTAGTDIRPIDAADDSAAAMLKAYVWTDHTERFDRLARAISMIREHGVDLSHADAGDWLEEQIARPQAAGVCRTLVHSIVWQYLPEATQERITRTMEAAGAEASAERPLAWVALETNRKTFRHELNVRYWPGDHRQDLLLDAHPHGSWIKWRAEE